MFGFYQEAGMDSGIVDWSQEKKVPIKCKCLSQIVGEAPARPLFRILSPNLPLDCVVSRCLVEWNVTAAVTWMGAALPDPPAV